MSARAVAVLLLAGVLGIGCQAPGWVPWVGEDAPPGPRPDRQHGVAVVEDAGIVDFYQRASVFYSRMALRRFNTLATYRDERLRDFFRTESAFADYYADLANTLDEHHFERNRPLTLEVVELQLEGPGQARVVTRMIGEDGRPLRWGEAELERVDRWERIQGAWWVVPEKL